MQTPWNQSGHRRLGVTILAALLGCCVTSAPKAQLTWTSNPSAASDVFNGICYGSGSYVACGVNNSGALVTTSETGDVWVPQHLGDFFAAEDAIWGHGLFVTVHRLGKAYWSADGVTWTAGATGVYVPLFGVCAGPEGFMAVGGDPLAGGVILSSSDAKTWTAVTGVSESPLQGVAYANGTFVVVGDNGTVLVSGDGGASWNKNPDWRFGSLRRVRHLEGRFVAVGSDGQITSSVDGGQWSFQVPIQRNYLHDVAACAGQWVAVGDQGTLLTSADGLEWASADSGTTAVLRGVAFGDRRFVAVGGHGTRLVSDRMAPVDARLRIRIEGSTARLETDSQPGFQYHLERAADFSGWEPVGPGQAGTGGALEWAEPIEEDVSHFFRMRIE
ncbi:MAG TPA: hypothetical protein PKM73_12700 [Verrucomicrobiota bacterium]|nr:hypothetical protein [Verrucomicrobiota bacterium]HNU50879.1 hypothetical protein [Verrucomicrobiota bacterium]